MNEEKPKKSRWNNFVEGARDFGKTAAFIVTTSSIGMFGATKITNAVTNAPYNDAKDKMEQNDKVYFVTGNSTQKDTVATLDLTKIDYTANKGNGLEKLSEEEKRELITEELKENLWFESVDINGGKGDEIVVASNQEEALEAALGFISTSSATFDMEMNDAFQQGASSTPTAPQSSGKVNQR